MISTFTSKPEDANDPDTNATLSYLMLSDEERQQLDDVQKPLPSLRRIANTYDNIRFIQGVGDADKNYTFTENVLDPEACEALSSFLSFLWKETSTTAPVGRVDLRANLPEEAFLRLLSGYATRRDDGRARMQTQGSLKTLWRNSRTDTSRAKFALRMTRGPTNACIDFHCDGGYATYTLQVALNEPTEYCGGRLCFYVPHVNSAADRIEEPQRKAGSMTAHSRNVLHAVTTLTSGTRMSLFVVDINNGLGQQGVFNVEMKHVEHFLEAFALPGLGKRKADSMKEVD
eukprot:gene23488-28438_t